MRYRRFGKTDWHLSVFSLGTMRCLASQEVFTRTLGAAIASGINHIETARGYGSSEQYLGTALRQLAVERERLYVTTKIPPTPDAASMAAAIDESLQRLQVDYLDGLAIHGINTEEHLAWVTGDRGCWQAIEDAIASGKVRQVGFSTHGSLELILVAIQTDRFAFVNLHYYTFFRRHEPAIALAAEKDLGVFIISPVDKGGQLYAPPETLKALCHPLTPLALNYRFLLGDRRIATLSLGASHPGELDDALALADRDEPLTPTESSILQKLDDRLVEALGTDLCRQCYQCLPCPEAIAIPEILRLRNLAIAYDMTGFGQYRYRMFENAGHWFPGNKGHRCSECGDCLPRCPQGLDIPHLLADTHQRLNGAPRRRLWEE